MLHFTLEIQARGSLLIGGGETPDGLHGTQVADHAGRPHLPASALRGALRHTLEALLRGADEPACDAGRGVPIGATMAQERECTLHNGNPCIACRLFGGSRVGLAAGTRDFSALVLGDGVCADDDAWMVRPGVAIERAYRSAADRRLFLRRSTKTDARFTAEGWLRDVSLRSKLNAAVAATTHIGAGRSRGMGRVDLCLKWSDSRSIEAGRLVGRDVRVRVALRSPALLGVPLVRENLRDTRREIPGAALRGAVGFALARTLERPEEHPGFQALVDEANGAQFGFLSPVEPGGSRGEPPGHLPLTTRSCKRDGVEHGAHDDLLDRLAVALLSDIEHVKLVRQALQASRCQKCDGPLRTAHGFRRYPKVVPTRVATRVSLERNSDSARDGALFTNVYLEPGTLFEGTIRKVPDESRALLAGLPSLPVSFGRAPSAGHGRVDIELVDAPARASLKERGQCFDDAVCRFLERCKLSSGVVGRLIPLTLLSPCVVDGAAGDPSEWPLVASTLPEPLRASPLVAVRRFARDGTWDQMSGTMHALETIVGGSVYVLCLPEGQHWQDHLDSLSSLEANGIGTRQHQGYGEVISFDPIHTNSGEVNR